MATKDKTDIVLELLSWEARYLLGSWNKNSNTAWMTGSIGTTQIVTCKKVSEIVIFANTKIQALFMEKAYLPRDFEGATPIKDYEE